MFIKIYDLYTDEILAKLILLIGPLKKLKEAACICSQ